MWFGLKKLLETKQDVEWMDGPSLPFTPIPYLVMWFVPGLDAWLNASRRPANSPQNVMTTLGLHWNNHTRVTIFILPGLWKLKHERFCGLLTCVGRSLCRFLARPKQCYCTNAKHMLVIDILFTTDNMGGDLLLWNNRTRSLILFFPHHLWKVCL